MEGEARYLKRKVKAGRIDVHPTDKAIVVFYEVEAVILGDAGQPMLGERKQCQKTIRVPSLSSSTNLPKLAEMIADKCKLIHPAKIPELEQLLAYLQRRSKSSKHDGRRLGKATEQQRSLLEHNKSSERAQMADVDDYINLLYEELPEKIRGTGLLLQLAQNPDNLEDLVQNERLMNSLSRELREQAAKATAERSIELSTNIIHVFFFFSSFSVFHDCLAQYKIGAQSLKFAANEVERLAENRVILEKKRRRVKAGKSTKEEYEMLVEEMAEQSFRQETLLYVALHLLLNLAEDTRVEMKMRNKNIVPILMSALENGENFEFLLLVVTFLKKLSIFLENKDEMAELGIVPKLARLIPCQNEVLLNVSLRLLLNLSFDGQQRKEIVDAGLLPRLVALMNKPAVPLVVVVNILYHISMDDSHKHQFSFTDCLPIVMRMILESQDDLVPTELVALGINLAANERCAQVLAEQGGLKFLLKRAVKSQDSLLMKMIRNLAIHESIREAFLDFIDPIARQVHTCQDDDLLVEVVGILASLSIPDFDYEKLIEEYELLDFVRDRLRPGAAEDDLVLEVAVLIGTVLADEACAKLVARAGLVQSLIDMLKAKQEDDEIVLQIVYVFYRLVYHETTREIVLGQTQAVSYLIDLMHDKNDEIRKMCTAALDIIMEYDEEWAARIRAEKFRFHNSHWIEMVLDSGVPAQGLADDEWAGEEGDMYDPMLAYHDAGELEAYAQGYEDIEFEDNGEEDEFGYEYEDEADDDMEYAAGYDQFGLSTVQEEEEGGLHENVNFY